MTAASKKSVKKQPRKMVRRRVWPAWMKPAILAAGAVSIVGIVAGAGWWAQQKGWVDAALARANALYIDGNRLAGFVVDDVLVEGRKETSKDTLIEALRIRRGDLICGVDVEAARERLEEIGWVASARVERHLPDTIRVAIRENSGGGLAKERKIPAGRCRRCGDRIGGIRALQKLEDCYRQGRAQACTGAYCDARTAAVIDGTGKGCGPERQSPLEPTDGQRGRCPIAGKGPVCRLGSFGGV